MEITLNLALVALGASVLTEIVKLFPKIRESDLLKSVVAIIIVALVAFLSNEYAWNWTYFFGVMAFAFANYKMIIQPVAKATGMKSQAE